MPPESPFAPAQFPDLPAIPGLRLGAISAGIKKSGAKDLFLAALAPGSTIAGSFTRSKTASAPVEWCRRIVAGGRARAILVNSGNANAFTGKAGEASVKATVAAAARALGCPASQILVSSTGVIGEPLPHERIVAALPVLAKSLGEDAWQDGAEAICTTDTFPKAVSREARIDGVTVHIAGIAKGSGMIAPDMATMLAYIFTDAKIPAPVLHALCRDSVDRSFNAITVDGDTSTSDTVLLAATGRARHSRIERVGDSRLREFRRALVSAMVELAKLVVRDGEGAQKFVTIRVGGASSAAAARRIGLAIANSPLVKTAIAGEDANWGRIVMAVGKSGQRVDRDSLAIRIGGVEVAARGARVPGYDEAPVARHMKGREILIEVDVGVGRGRAEVWTCDLTHGYISINADYRS